MRSAKLTALLAAGLLAACSSSKERVPADAPGYVKGKAVHPTVKIGRPYKINGDRYYPEYEPDYDEVGMASWYGPNFHGKSTANGEEFNQWAMTAAHKTLPMPSMVKVTRTDNGKSVMVRINDRGPFAHGRIIDLSRAAAEALGVDKMGVAEVRVQYLKDETEQYIASLGQKPPAEWQSALATAAPVVTVAPAPQPILSAPAPVMIATAPVPQPVISATPLPAMPQPVYAEGEGLKPLPFGLRQAPEPVVQPETGYQTGSFAVLDDAPQDPADAQAAGNHYYIQAGSFSLRDNAMRFAGKLEELGPTEVVPVPISDGTLWRVRVGPVFNRGIATEIQTQLTTHGVTDATIIYQP